MSKITDYIHEVLELAGIPADSDDAEELRSHLTDMVADYERSPTNKQWSERLQRSGVRKWSGSACER